MREWLVIESAYKNCVFRSRLPKLAGNDIRFRQTEGGMELRQSCVDSGENMTSPYYSVHGSPEIDAIVEKAILNERERCAKIVQGEVHKERYRMWPRLSKSGNRSDDSDIVKFCDSLAAAIRDPHQ